MTTKFSPFDPDTLRSVLNALAWVNFDNTIRDIIDQTGWLPYPGVEQYLAGIAQDIKLADQRIEAFVDQEWINIRKNMEEAIAACNTDEETKAVFNEALQAHQYGLYRCTCRCLIPEIERALRVKVNNLGKSFKFEKNLVEVINRGDLSDLIGDNPYGLALFSQLRKYLFATVDSEQDRSKMELNLNRHAVVHGLIPYNTKQASFNALVLSLYWFSVLANLA